MCHWTGTLFSYQNVAPAPPLPPSPAEYAEQSNRTIKQAANDLHPLPRPPRALHKTQGRAVEQ